MPALFITGPLERGPPPRTRWLFKLRGYVPSKAGRWRPFDYAARRAGLRAGRRPRPRPHQPHPQPQREAAAPPEPARLRL